MKDFLLLIRSRLKFILLFLLLALFLGVGFFDRAVRIQITKNKILPVPFPVTAPAQYPLINRVLGIDTSDFKQEGESSDISAHAIIVMDNDSKVIFFSKNPNLRFSPASTVKIMTALVALEHYKMNDVLTIKSEDVEPVVVGFKNGERLFFEDLLYAMLLPSGNDATLAIAQNYPGGEEVFVRKMNEKAASFHLYNTRFSDPIGLLDNSNYTTAFDLARLASIALQNQTFSKIVATKHKIIADFDGSNPRLLNNLNKLLGINGVNGIKTGYTDEAQGVLVTSKVEKGHILIIVVMKSQDRFLDTQKILDLISGNITYLTIHP